MNAFQTVLSGLLFAAIILGAVKLGMDYGARTTVRDCAKAGALHHEGVILQCRIAGYSL